jgi:hypothetical protein
MAEPCSGLSRGLPTGVPLVEIALDPGQTSRPVVTIEGLISAYLVEVAVFKYGN